jgi:glutamate synthase (NADPH/NADH) large chain
METGSSRPYGLPERQGLYDPENEHDSCGVAFVANVSGKKSHDVVQKALTVLENLSHRGACGCDPQTGDGAGILLQIPHEFFRRELAAKGINLPAPGRYGVGAVFLPRDAADHGKCQEILERAIREEGQTVLGWRDVPVDNSALGWLARKSEPVIRQVFVGRGTSTRDEDCFERKLYVIRRRAEKAVAEARLQEGKLFYLSSLSAVTLVYKGLMIATQVAAFYRDLLDPLVKSALALVHSRFSTNTFPTWELAHPYRFLAHNGEINALRGNRNWMRARTAALSSELFGEDLEKLLPILTETGSDSMTIDNALEFLVKGGRSLAHAMMMLIPEAWNKDARLDPEKRAFYEYHACLMEPWDGPAAILFTDGRQIGAVLDRNGLRPARYTITKSGCVVMASEVGVLPIPPEEVLYKGKMKPGKLFLVDTVAGRVIDDSEIKHRIIYRRPYRRWLAENKIELGDLPPPPPAPPPDHHAIQVRQMAFGYTLEDLRILMAPMARDGEEAVGSMGTDTPLAVLSSRPQPLYNYFKQLFAQVTNPPIDSIREEMVMSLESYIGREGNLLDETPKHCHLLKLPRPILTNEELEQIRHIAEGDFRSITLPMLFPVKEGPAGLGAAVEGLCRKASQAVRDGTSIVILSDRGVNPELAPIPSLLACSAVHHALVREGTRTEVGLVLESGEARETMHFALLIGYGAGAINPYLAFETLDDMIRETLLPAELSFEKAHQNYIKSIQKALLKVIAKMGISTIQSYRGAQIFEAIGLNQEVVDRYFTGTASRISGVGLAALAQEALQWHRLAFPGERPQTPILDVGGQYQWRRGGEYHMYNPDTVAKLQQAVRSESFKTFEEYSRLVNSQAESLCTLRGLLKFREGQPVPLEEVEPASEIVKRFATGAMSFGSISKEAHENLAIAMNRIGGKSNTGEGGEDPGRYRRDPNGDWRRSAVKQVASARFGVTTEYLVNADELQIKMAQGAKPGEGGQLPGHKVDKFIAKIRYSTPGVSLISPPPHHDIYSIEDLAQLIHDLKNVNPEARVSVKLVAEVGVGTVAAGVAKAHADVVLISGDSGGTGASPLTSIKHAGIPWELGLAETQQVLVLNDLRGRIVVQTDGQLKTGRDVAIAALLGAEEFGFATAPLVASGCIMMRVCHLNTCPVGIATQDPVLRKKFNGKPENVINFMFFVAEELRAIMARLGFRTVKEMVGRVDMLDPLEALDHWKAQGLDFSKILYRPKTDAQVAIHRVQPQDHGLEDALDHQILELSREAVENRNPVVLNLPIRNTNRTVGAMLSGEIARRYGNDGLPEDTITINFTGSAGLSFGAFLARGVTLNLEGDANDYVGKGLSGGRIVVRPPARATFLAEENIIAGNTVLYGATGGEAYFRGQAGERFAVRNSGARAVVEGVGDHGCEYMTGGLVVVLGPTGRNFAAGMSGGIAYVFDEEGLFADRCNQGMVELEPVVSEKDVEDLRALIESHIACTGSSKAERILRDWSESLPRFVKIMPVDYRRSLLLLEEERRRLESEEAAAEAAAMEPKRASA